MPQACDLLRPARAARFSLVVTLVGALAALGCVSTQDIDGLHRQIGELQQQLLQLQAQAAAKQDLERFQAELGAQSQSLLKSQTDTRVELRALESQLGEVKAQLESTNVNLGDASQQIAALLQELRARAAAATAAAPPPAAEDPKALYEAAYNEYLRGNYDVALVAFQNYIAVYPATDLSDNAVYWLGECLYRQRKYRPAIQEFERVARQFPHSDKLASASLKKGYALLELGERQQGVTQLRLVVRDFPAGDEASLAKQRLREIGVDQR
jgi:tol-pal system protein YbgF